MKNNSEPENKSRTRTSFPEMEEAVLGFWDEADTFAKSLAKEAPKGEFVFYDGPPFATGTPHYGHLVGSIIKDAVPRYRTMRGYHVERKWGWDCHGLPIENIVEKELGTKTKKEIEALGVGKFNDLCRARVSTYIEDWKKTIKHLGRWADMDHAYRTMDKDYMETVWWVFKQLWEKGLIYQDYRSMHICPRCETTLSQSEVTEGYRDIKDLSCTAKFELVDEPGTYVLAWTTTPWTLIGNVALAVGEDIDYVKITSGDASYILAKERLADNFKDQAYEIVSEFKGSTLVGRAYKPPFDYYYNDQSLPNRENGWKIYAADFVTTEDGVGVVHIAPAFGEDDMALGKKENLPFIQHVGMDGIFKPEVKDFPGLHVKPADDHMATDVEIIKYLAAHGTLFSKAKYEHSYPHCWRCDTPLLNYATSSWFINVTGLKPELLKTAEGIGWTPEHLKAGRFGKWLEGARDWSISRQRFWASAIPIWECPNGHRHVVGSLAELEKLSGAEGIDDIHKDKVDPITFPCPECGGTMKRVPDVLDCWLESGSMPYAQLHYPFENKEKLENNFPAQFIAEGVDQCRTWFYYTHVVSGALRGTRAFDHAIANGIVLAEDGKKMSKKLKNYPDPNLVMEKYGADALRAYLLASPVVAAENLNFSEAGVEEALRKNVMVLWNVYKFYELYAAGAGIDKEKARASRNVLDRWIIAKLDQLIAEMTAAFENYDLPRATRPLAVFVDELSTWYLRRSRDRFRSEDEADKASVLATSGYVLNELAKLMAPALPFMAETLWQKTSGYDFKDKGRSVHLEAWPEAGTADRKVLELMEEARHLVELGLAERDAAGIKIRQMLSGLAVKGGEELPEEYLALVKDELNIREISWEPGENLEVVLDTAITPELKQEGIARDLVRLINRQRKEEGLEIDDLVRTVIGGASEEVRAVIEAKRTEIARDTKSAEIVCVSGIDAAAAAAKLDGAVFSLEFKR